MVLAGPCKIRAGMKIAGGARIVPLQDPCQTIKKRKAKGQRKRTKSESPFRPYRVAVKIFFFLQASAENFFLIREATKLLFSGGNKEMLRKVWQYFKAGHTYTGTILFGEMETFCWTSETHYEIKDKDSNLIFHQHIWRAL